MSKSLVEKYEQMLTQDPASTVFVELARAYIESGEHARAIHVCQQGLGHHPSSVVGRVLWGKALINVGRAAEAMSQFDLAMNVDRDNPHAYNLITEVLLRKGLYRSALPILRKAVALQPNDGRIKQWLEQARGALSGGPPPVLYDSTGVDTHPLEENLPTQQQQVAPFDTATTQRDHPPVPGELPPGQESTTQKSAVHQPKDPDVFSSFAAGDLEPESPTVVMNAYTPTGDASGSELPMVPAEPHVTVSPIRTRSQEELPLVAGEVTPSQEQARLADEDLEVRRVLRPVDAGRTTQEIPAPDPFATLAAHAEQAAETVRGLTSTFQSLARGDSQVVSQAELPPPSSAEDAESQGEASVIPARDLLIPDVPSERRQGGLLDEVTSAPTDLPTAEIHVPGSMPVAMPRAEAARLQRVPSPASGGLLDEIPDFHAFEAPSSVDVPKVELNPQATEAIAREYEAELRAKLEVKTAKKTFLQRHGVKLIASAVLLVVAASLGGGFVWTRVKHKGESLNSALGKGMAAASADTKEQYLAALQSLDAALQMDDGSADAWAWKAYAHAVLYAEHTHAPADRDAALQALARPSVREAHPELAAVVEYFTSEPANLTTARQQLLGSGIQHSVVHGEAGRLLLADKKYDEALKRLQKAVELDSKNVRALVALGDYYLAFEDYEQALQVLAGPAEQLSRYQPARVMGVAEARMELAREVPEALSELEGLTKNVTVPPALQARYALLLGRALSLNSHPEEALKVLSQGLEARPQEAFDFQMGLGSARRTAGQMAPAQRAYEEALKLRPKSEAAREGLGRVLLARGREKELLDQVKGDRELRKVALVRGIAWSRLGDFKKARAELQATQVSGKFPAEAVVYLALADAAEEQQSDKAVQMLEKLITQARRHKATVQVALARVYLQRGALDLARIQLVAAAKDPGDSEGNALLGELLLNAGVPPEVALEPLQRSVDRNGSSPRARHLLTRALLALGKLPEAVKNVEAWLEDSPALDLAWVDAAQVYLRMGRVNDAEAAIVKADKLGADTVEAYRVKATVLFARGDSRAAFASLERANKLNPKDPETFCQIGDAFVRQGSNDTAFRAYEAATREDAKSLCGALGPHHAHPGLRGAKQTLGGLLKRAPDSYSRAAVQATLARVQVEERDLKGAQKNAEDALQAEPALAEGWFALAEVAKRQKDDAKQLEALQKATAYDASWAAVHLALADLLAKTEATLPRAIAEYDAVQQLSQNDSDVGRAKRAATALRKQLQK